VSFAGTGKGRVIRDGIFQAQVAEPSIGEIELDLPADLPPRPAKAIPAQSVRCSNSRWIGWGGTPAHHVLPEGPLPVAGLGIERLERGADILREHEAEGVGGNAPDPPVRWETAQNEAQRRRRPRGCR